MIHSDKTVIHHCTSCGVCATICARKAITIALDEDGFYRPVIDETLCNNCGLCTTVCYKFDQDVKLTTEEDLKKKPLYSAWANDNNIVKETTSGGIGDLLSHELLKEGYKVVGVVYNENQIRAEHLIAESSEVLDAFRGSKYIQSYSFDAFKEVVQNCRKEKYAVFGTPCQIYALSKIAIQQKSRDNFFFVDLYCHGCPSLYTWVKYQDNIKKKNGVKKLDKVTFRSKTRGWGSFNVETIVGGKPVISSNDRFYELFFSDQLLNGACNDCLLRSTLEYTDIRLGDFWGKKFLNNYRGVSAVSVSTERGKKLFDMISDRITFSVCEYEDFLPWQSWGKSYTTNTDLRQKVLRSLSNPKEDISDAIHVLRSNQSLLSNIIRVVRTVLSCLPQRSLNLLKSVKYSWSK